MVKLLRFRPLAYALALLAWCGVLAAADAPTPDKPKSAAAVAAITKADKAVAEAEAACRAAVAKARRQEAEDLKAAQEAALKNGTAGLEEANRIGAAVKRVQAEVELLKATPVGLDAVRDRITRQKTFTLVIVENGKPSTRTLELLPGGRFGKGGGEGYAEKRWYVGGDDARPVLVIDSDEWAPVALSLAEGLTFKGSGKAHPKWEAVTVRPAD